MSGAIQDLPLYVCRACLTPWMADDHMYEEPDRCPKCGLQASDVVLPSAGAADVEDV